MDLTTRENVYIFDDVQCGLQSFLTCKYFLRTVPGRGKYCAESIFKEWTQTDGFESADSV